MASVPSVADVNERVVPMRGSSGTLVDWIAVPPLYSVPRIESIPLDM